MRLLLLAAEQRMGRPAGGAADEIVQRHLDRGLGGAVAVHPAGHRRDGAGDVLGRPADRAPARDRRPPPSCSRPSRRSWSGAEAASPQPTMPLSASIRTRTLSACLISTPAMNTGFFIGKLTAIGSMCLIFTLQSPCQSLSQYAPPVRPARRENRRDGRTRCARRRRCAAAAVAQDAHAILRQAARPCRRRRRRRDRSDGCRRFGLRSRNLAIGESGRDGSISSIRAAPSST